MKALQRLFFPQPSAEKHVYNSSTRETGTFGRPRLLLWRLEAVSGNFAEASSVGAWMVSPSSLCPPGWPNCKAGSIISLWLGPSIEMELKQWIFFSRCYPNYWGMDERVMQNFVEAWNLLVHKRVGYECQQDLQLVEISPNSEAEVALVEDGSMGRALFMTLVPCLAFISTRLVIAFDSHWMMLTRMCRALSNLLKPDKSQRLTKLNVFISCIAVGICRGHLGYRWNCTTGSWSRFLHPWKRADQWSSSRNANEPRRCCCLIWELGLGCLEKKSWSQLPRKSAHGYHIWSIII